MSQHVAERKIFLKQRWNEIAKLEMVYILQKQLQQHRQKSHKSLGVYQTTPCQIYIYMSKQSIFVSNSFLITFSAVRDPLSLFQVQLNYTRFWSQGLHIDILWSDRGV